MKIKYLNKFWKVGFVALITSVGFNLTSCGSKPDQIETAFKAFVYDYQKNINLQNTAMINNGAKTNNVILLDSDSDTDYPPHRPDILEFEIGMHGSYRLTGNATKDYTYFRQQIITLLTNIEPSYAKLVTAADKSTKSNSGDNILDRSISVEWIIYFISPDGTKHYNSGFEFYLTYFSYNEKTKKFIYNPGIEDKWNLEGLSNIFEKNKIDKK